MLTKLVRWQVAAPRFLGALFLLLVVVVEGMTTGT